MPYIDLTKDMFVGQSKVELEQIAQYLDSVEAQAKRIAENSSRPFDTIIQACLDGTMVEVGILNALLKATSDAGLNPKKFNKADSDSYAWDVKAMLEYKDEFTYRFFEVKSLKSVGDIKEFCFNYQANQPGLDLSTYIKYGTGPIGITDFLVLAAFEKCEDPYEYIITPKYIFDSAYFNLYVKPATTGYLTHSVDVNKMIEAGHARKIQ